MRVLVIEDDPMIGEAVQGALRDAAYAADWVRDGREALAALASQHYDAALLDLGLPGKDGHAVLKAVRDRQDPLPVLIMTARDAIEERIAGLDGGADDYLTKPFAIAELLARLRAVMRRKGGNASPRLTNGLVTLDPATHEATVGNEPTVQLTNREFAVLQALLTRPGTILSRAELEDRVYGWGDEVESNAIEFLIHALRKKLGRDVIKNVRGAGWMIPRAS